MVSRVLSCLVCVVCVAMLPAVWADDCSGYWDMSGVFQATQQCGMYCCGDCSHKYCCTDKNYHLTEQQQGHCPARSVGRYNHGGVLAGSIIGTVFPIVLCLTLIICCVAPCCLCYKKCRKGRNRRHTTVVNSTTIVHAPPQPFSPSGYQPSNPGYHPVPGYGFPPMPTAPPPSYMESTSPARSPVAFTSGQPMYPLQPLNLPHAPMHSDETVQLPYNPSYQPNP